MAKGVSIHLGLNSVDPNHYQGWSGPLNACEFDAEDMAQIAKTNGFTSKLLLTKDATRSALITSLADAAKQLKSGDFCFLTYSGHGGQVPDRNGDEEDSADETWCLYDGELIDDELYSILTKFAADVRVLVLSDSCHSGTAIKQQRILQSYANLHPLTRPLFQDTQISSSYIYPVYRAMPSEIAQRVYLANKVFYDDILKDPKLAEAIDNVEAACILISGCQDAQLSGDGAFNGVFTGRLKSVWNGGKFKGDYTAFWKAIAKGMPLDQTPNLFTIGKQLDAFKSQKPFAL